MPKIRSLGAGCISDIGVFKVAAKEAVAINLSSFYRIAADSGTPSVQNISIIRLPIRDPSNFEMRLTSASSECIVEALYATKGYAVPPAPWRVRDSLRTLQELG